MHFAIVEDLESDRQNITSLIKKDCAAHGDTVEFSIYSRAEDFLADFRAGFCNAVFLDIMLGNGMTGVDIAWKIRELDEYLPIIFTTTETGFALESYGIHALEFLVKPVQPESLRWCMERLREAMAAPEYLDVREVDEYGRLLPARCILLEDLVHTETLRRGCVLHTTNGDVVTPQTHGDLMKQLPHTGRFFEYARGTSVNLSFVESIDPEGTLLLKTGQQLFCSRRKIKDTIEAYKQYQFAQLRGKGV